MPYLPHGGGDHCRKGIWFRWMGVFHCPARPSLFPHPSPASIFSSAPTPHTPCPPHLEAFLPCQSHETVYSCLADSTCLNRACAHTRLPIPSMQTLISLSQLKDWMVSCVMLAVPPGLPEESLCLNIATLQAWIANSKKCGILWDDKYFISTF